MVAKLIKKIAKVDINFIVSVSPPVRPSVRKKQLGSYWTDFHEICSTW